MENVGADKVDEERVAVNVERVEPLDSLDDGVGGPVSFSQEPIGKPRVQRARGDAASKPVDKGRGEGEVGVGQCSASFEGGAGRYGGRSQKSHLQHRKRWIVAGPSIFGLLAIVGQSEDATRLAEAQRYHFVQGCFEIHLIETARASQDWSHEAQRLRPDLDQAFLVAAKTPARLVRSLIMDAAAVPAVMHREHWVQL